MSNRQLATLRIVSEIEDIEGTQNLQTATVDSWKVVVNKNQGIKKGQLIVYFEIDSWIPLTIFEHKKPKEYNGIMGSRLKTISIRGHISQGLILTTEELNIPGELQENTDLTELLGIVKWEPFEDLKHGNPEGNFPEFIPKTEQKRIQNLTKKFDGIKEQQWEITEKLDGSSMTVYHYKGYSGVCSRNLEIKESDNTFTNVAKREKLLDKIGDRNIALQGELVGSKIGKNGYGIRGHEFYLFDIYDIDKKAYYTPNERLEFANEHGIKHVPIIEAYPFKIDEKVSIDDIIALSNDNSKLNGKLREGIVFKNGEFSFKVINNHYLLNEK